MLDIILDSFKGLTPILWASQICGLIGFVIILVSYQFKKLTYLIIATVSMLFFFLEQILAGLASNMVVTMSSLVRNCLLIIYLWKKNTKAPDYMMYILMGIVWVVEIIMFATKNELGKWDNYLPPLMLTIATLTANSKNYYILKVGALIHEAGFMIYYAIYNLPFSMFRQLILVISIVISVIVMIIKDIKARNKEVLN